MGAYSVTNSADRNPSLTRRLSAEALGAFFLLTAIVGSGIMADRLSGGDAMLALLGNTFPTGAILIVLILVLGPVSGAHFNPAVTLAFLVRKEIAAAEAVAYMLVQVTGGILGVAAAHAMFEMPLIQVATTERTGIGQWTGELIATFGLVATILGTLRCRPEALLMPSVCSLPPPCGSPPRPRWPIRR